MMVIEHKPEVIEVSEDAYKQNTIYRPWPEDKASKTVAEFLKRYGGVSTVANHIGDDYAS